MDANVAMRPAHVTTRQKAESESSVSSSTLSLCGQEEQIFVKLVNKSVQTTNKNAQSHLASPLRQNTCIRDTGTSLLAKSALHETKPIEKVTAPTEDSFKMIKVLGQGTFGKFCVDQSYVRILRARN